MNTPLSEHRPESSDLPPRRTLTIYPLRAHTRQQPAIAFPAPGEQDATRRRHSRRVCFSVTRAFQRLDQHYYKAFAPRIGLNWSQLAMMAGSAKLTGGPGRTSVSMGFGMSTTPSNNSCRAIQSRAALCGSNFIGTVSSDALCGSYRLSLTNPFSGILLRSAGHRSLSTLPRSVYFGHFAEHANSVSESIQLDHQAGTARHMLLQLAYDWLARPRPACDL